MLFSWAFHFFYILSDGATWKFSLFWRKSRLFKRFFCLILNKPEWNINFLLLWVAFNSNRFQRFSCFILAPSYSLLLYILNALSEWWTKLFFSAHSQSEHLNFIFYGHHKVKKTNKKLVSMSNKCFRSNSYAYANWNLFLMLIYDIN